MFQVTYEQAYWKIIFRPSSYSTGYGVCKSSNRYRPRLGLTVLSGLKRGEKNIRTFDEIFEIRSFTLSRPHQPLGQGLGHRPRPIFSFWTELKVHDSRPRPTYRKIPNSITFCRHQSILNMFQPAKPKSGIPESQPRVARTGPIGLNQARLNVQSWQGNLRSFLDC